MPGSRTSPYKIKKNRKAHYALLNIDAPPAAVTEMERRMRIATDVIRFLTIRVEEHEAEPTALVRKSDREERPRGGGRFGDREGGGPVVRAVRAASATTVRRARIVATVPHEMARVRSATVRHVRWVIVPRVRSVTVPPRDAAPRTGGDSSENKS